MSTRTTFDPATTLDEFAAISRSWLESVLERRDIDGETVWGHGSDDVAVFHALAPADELELLRRGSEWQRQKLMAGFGAINWPIQHGGAGLTDFHAQVFREEEMHFVAPASHELLRVTVNLVAPTVRVLGTADQWTELLQPLLAAEVFACQLFSEPGAGSDLASVATRATRDGDDWVINGSKVWASGAQFAQWGELIARTDPTAAKHAGMTALLVPLDAPGVEVRPIRQMSGGASFNEVFLDDVRIPDSLRLGEEGDGWRTALTTLGFERAQSGAKRVGGSWEQLLALAKWAQQAHDPVVRQELMKVYTGERLRELTRRRAQARARTPGATPGPEGSLGKLLWTTGMNKISEVASTVLGPRLVADSGEWGTYAWAAHVLGAPGFRIAGGSDEIQRNIIGERVLGLPPEPRVDKDVPFGPTR